MIQLPTLTTNQQVAFNGVEHALKLTKVVELRSGDGRGRTSVLRALHERHGGAFLSLADFVAKAAEKHPLSLEDALYNLLVAAIEANEYVFVDDFHVATRALLGCHFYPRSGYLTAPMKAACDLAVKTGRRLILADDGSAVQLDLHEACWSFSIPDPTPEDY